MIIGGWENTLEFIGVKIILMSYMIACFPFGEAGLSDALSDANTSINAFMDPTTQLGVLKPNIEKHMEIESMIKLDLQMEGLENQLTIGSDLPKEDLESTTSIHREISLSQKGSSCGFTSQMLSSPKGRLLSVGKQSVSSKNSSSPKFINNSLTLLISTFILRFLFSCDLIVFIDKKFEKSEVLEELLRFSNFKQIVEVDSLESAEQQVIWKSQRCQGTIILLSDPKFLLEFGDRDPRSWAFRSKVIIADQTKTTLESFLQTKKAKKTEYIIGLVKAKDGHYNIYTNELYHGRRGLVHISSWRGNKLSKAEDKELFPDKMKDLRGAELKVVVFEWPPSITYHRDSNGNLLYLYGQDITLIQALAQTFNFTIFNVESPIDENFGFKLPNGSFNGMVGMYERDVVDVGACNIWVGPADNRLDFQDFSSPYTMDYECALLPLDPPLPLWHSPGLPFKMITWIVIFTGMIFAGPILYSLIKASNEGEPGYKDHRRLTTLSLYTFGAHFSHPMTYLPKNSSSKIFVAFLWIYSIILTTGYRSNLTAFLTISRNPKSFETIKELYESPMRIVGNPYSHMSLSGSINPYIKGLAERFELVYVPADQVKPALAGDGAAVNGKLKLEMLKLQNSAPSGKPVTRVMKECFTNFAVSVMFQKNSPLTKRFNNVIMGMKEGGLAERWFDDSLNVYHRLRKQAEKENDNSTLEKPDDSGRFIPLGLDHLQGVFIVWTFGSLVSSIFFTFERIIH